MGSWRDRLHQVTGKTRFVVCRLFVHVAGPLGAPLLGTLNRVCREALAAEGDLTILGEGLVDVCQHVLELETVWRSAANEGQDFWDEGEAGDYVTELFTDSAQRYLSDFELEERAIAQDEPLTLPITRNLVVMLTVAYEGDVPDLETNLTSVQALQKGLRAVIDLHYQERLRAIQIHFSPAQLGDELTDEQLLLNFPELVPL